MTCIVGIEHNKKVYIGADSLASTSQFKHETLTPKVFKLRTMTTDLLIGYTTSFRFGDIMRYRCGAPPVDTAIKSVQDAEEYLITEFVPSMQAAMAANGYDKEFEGAKQTGNMLIGIKGYLFEIQSDYSVIKAKYGYCSVGSGYLAAYSSLYTSEGLIKDPEARIKKAIKTAAEFIPSVGGMTVCMSV